MNDAVMPTIGSKGTYTLKSPLEGLILPEELFTCQAIRSLSEYLANNEDPKVSIYEKYKIPEAEYDIDLANNEQIVSLQSEKGHWVIVPARYIITYPLVNGIAYRGMMIGVALPSLPANRDFSNVITDMKNLVKDTIGVDCSIKLVETSRIAMITKEKHDLLQSARDTATNGKLTDRSRLKSLEIEHQAALNKITELENFIKAKYK